ncbi:putative protein SUPPRESSOR OF QUENCHING 1, chloroplastic [Cocos nucifera]|uniref:Uncharacterized protein n=1 Tax=Cocos nucifera TaxID=13894 RepID=A0A8K0IYK2_COCNU|nr:putative protein SUPPRESSOR OF QUENCHING 1, chloroplastic [Cocos nucifera]
MIKKLDPITKKVTTLAGTGSAGFKDGLALSAQLFEPSGIVDAGNGRLLIADTNNNMIRYIDLNEKDLILHTLELKGVQPPSSKPKSLKRLRRRLSADTQIIKTDGGSSMEGYLNLAVSVPEGYHFSKHKFIPLYIISITGSETEHPSDEMHANEHKAPEALSKFDVESEPANAINIEPSNGNLNPDGSASLHFGRTTPSPVTGRINCKVYYCKEDEVCLYQSLVFNVLFQQGVSESTKGKITLSYLVAPKVPSGTPELAFSK